MRIMYIIYIFFSGTKNRFGIVWRHRVSQWCRSGPQYLYCIYFAVIRYRQPLLYALLSISNTPSISLSLTLSLSIYPSHSLVLSSPVYIYIMFMFYIFYIYRSFSAYMWVIFFFSDVYQYINTSGDSINMMMPCQSHIKP